jgi:hypothetical protein
VGCALKKKGECARGGRAWAVGGIDGLGRTFSEDIFSTVWYICDSARPVTEGAATLALAGSSVPNDLRDTRLQAVGGREGILEGEQKNAVGPLVPTN